MKTSLHSALILAGAIAVLLARSASAYENAISINFAESTSLNDGYVDPSSAPHADAYDTSFSHFNNWNGGSFFDRMDSSVLDATGTVVPGFTASFGYDYQSYTLHGINTSGSGSQPGRLGYNGIGAGDLGYDNVPDTTHITLTGIPWASYQVAVLTGWYENNVHWKLVAPGAPVEESGNGTDFGAGYIQGVSTAVGNTFTFNLNIGPFNGLGGNDGRDGGGSVYALQILKLPPPVAFWTGAAVSADGLWSSFSNFSTDQAGTISLTGSLNGAVKYDVVFNATGVAGPVSSTLGANQSIKTLTLNSPAAVGIGGSDTLTITPDSATAGITVVTGSGPVTHTISSKVALGASQTWTVADANQTLVVSGNVSVSGDPGTVGLTKAGAGTLDLNGQQAYNTFVVTGGTTNVNGALGTLPANGTATVTVSPGAKLKFGNVSQTLSSLTIGAGATVTFTSGMATGSFSGSGKAPSFGGAAVVPEPGTLGLLLVGALGLLNRRRRHA